MLLESYVMCMEGFWSFNYVGWNLCIKLLDIGWVSEFILKLLSMMNIIGSFICKLFNWGLVMSDVILFLNWFFYVYECRFWI